MCICDLTELEMIVWMTPPKPLPVPSSQMKPDSEKSPASSIRWGRCYGENCIPWRLSARLWNVGGALQVDCEGGLPWPLGLVCVCFMHVCPCLTMCCLFATVYIYYSAPAFKADHSREQSVFIDFFFFFFLTSCFKAQFCVHSFLLFLLFFFLSFWIPL